MIALSVLTLLASANANSLHTAGAKGKHMSRDEACQLNPGSITQSADCGIQSGVGLSCTYGGIVAGDNHYLRRFFLAADHNITTKYSVKNVQFGIEEIILNPTTPQMPLAVNLYSIPSSATFDLSNAVLVGTTTFNADSTDNMALVTATVTGAVDGSQNDLVVEFVAPDYKSNTRQQGSFYPGANQAGQTEPCYLIATECGISTPTDFADLGFVVDLAMVADSFFF
jgi:hypothetical protein